MLYEVITVVFVRDHPRTGRERCAQSRTQFQVQLVAEKQGPHRRVVVVRGKDVLLAELHQRLDAGAARVLLRALDQFRITSYNVCYTKLLRDWSD